MNCDFIDLAFQQSEKLLFSVDGAVCNWVIDVDDPYFVVMATKENLVSKCVCDV
ncbi:hypothetical protein CDAR_38271, partial [Caerostris darwini]